jgi:predicted Abi (CAAX) family protease
MQLGNSLERTLAPLAIVRPDWRENAAILAGIDQGDFGGENNLMTQLLSWRTVIPRVAYDETAAIFFNHGAELWFLRTNQVGGWNDSIVPLAPTQLFGQYLAVPTLFSRLMESLQWPTMPDVWWTVGLTLLYGAIALPIGYKTGFLHGSHPERDWHLSRSQQVKVALIAVVTPAFLEELVMRVLLLPHPSESVLPQTLLIWVVVSLTVYVLYHPANALTFYRAAYPTFLQPVFLLLTGLLGLTCTVLYLQTGSIWTIAFTHWIVVVTWLLWLGGYGKLHQLSSASLQTHKES